MSKIEEYVVYNTQSDMWLCDYDLGRDRLWLPAVISGSNVEYLKIILKELIRIIRNTQLITKNNKQYVVLFPIINNNIDYNNGISVENILKEIDYVLI
jgi:hypothetical protein